MEFLQGAGVAMLTPSSLDAFDGPYDLWEEAAKEMLELLLEAENQPMILLDSSTECESACLVGCLRRLQHWSICAIQDEVGLDASFDKYQMMTLRNTSYDTSQRFIERFDLDLVTLKGDLPAWFREHITMLQEERAAEEVVMRTDPDRPQRAWAQGLCPSHDELAAPGGDTVLQDYTKRCVIRGDISDVSPRRTTRDAAGGNQAHAVQGEDPPSPTEADEDGKKDAGASSKGARDDGQGCGAKNKAAAGKVPDYRFNGFVYACPLVSAKSRFTAKAWLQDEDD